MLVTATKKGFYLQERQIGEEFDFPEDALKQVDGKPVFPLWFAPTAVAKATIAKAKAKAEGKGKKPEPNTMSGMNKTGSSGGEDLA